jgi:peptidyl-prolyl cis-trans isomerase A (cyclophilin A)
MRNTEREWEWELLFGGHRRAMQAATMKVTLSLPVLAGLLIACSKNQPEPASSSPSEPTASPAASAATALATASAATAAPKPSSSAPLASGLHPDLLDPSKATAKAPETFKAKFTTTKGDVVVEVHRAWSPNGADRFYNLVKMGFYDDTRFFRTVENFMAQFGISGDPAVSAKWQEQGIPDDPVKQSNKRGFVTFAQRPTPGSRTTQVFINYGDNSRLDNSFAPFGQVVQGMDIVDSFYKGYGEAPNQGFIQSKGNAYLDGTFPNLDGVKRAVIM